MGRQRVPRRAWLAASCCITVALVGSMPDESENVGRERSSTVRVNSVAEVWGEFSTALVEFDPTSAYSNPFDLRERLFTFGAMTVRHTTGQLCRDPIRILQVKIQQRWRELSLGAVVWDAGFVLASFLQSGLA